MSIGITADSFIVFFERVKDEIRNGRDMNSSVEIGWNRGKRTILASDGVNFIAAVVLYFVSVGGVRGFAFTLGLTTIVDVIVVFLFTHPIIRYLIKTEFFGVGHPASGFDPVRLGAMNVKSLNERKRIFKVNEIKRKSLLSKIKERNIGAGFKDKKMSNKTKISKSNLTLAMRKRMSKDKSVNKKNVKDKDKKWVVEDED